MLRSAIETDSLPELPFMKEKGGDTMRIFLKILCAPIMLLLILFIHSSAFLLTVSSGLLGLAGTIFAILGTIIFFAADRMNGSIVLIVLPISCRSALPDGYTDTLDNQKYHSRLSFLS